MLGFRTGNRSHLLFRVAERTNEHGKGCGSAAFLQKQTCQKCARPTSNLRDYVSNWLLSNDNKDKNLWLLSTLYWQNQKWTVAIVRRCVGLLMWNHKCCLVESFKLFLFFWCWLFFCSSSCDHGIIFGPWFYWVVIWLWCVVI